MKIIFALLRWIYQILAGLCMLFVSMLLSSLAFELPFKRVNVDMKLAEWTTNPTSQWIMGITGVVLLAVIFIYLYIRSRMIREDPSIAFENPDGEVSISIRAIEDFVGRVGRDFPEVKTLEPSIIARRDGVQILLKGELWSGPNIPKLTEKIQNLVKNQVQNILGIENVQSVTLNVSKILARDKDYQMPAQPDIFAGQAGSTSGTVNVPYHGSPPEYQ